MELSGLGQWKGDSFRQEEIVQDINLYPQGGDERVLLREKFSEQLPFYLRQNKPVIFRKTNERHAESAMVAARSRFEDGLKLAKTENAKNIEEFHQYMDETSKFQELKDMRAAQSKQLVRSVLEQQMEQEKLKRVESRENRRSAMGGGVTFGPKETDQTILFQQLKKRHD